MGGQVAVISFAKPEHVRRFAEHLGHPFLWLADPERRSYQHLGLGRRGPLAIMPPRVVWEHVKFALGRIAEAYRSLPAMFGVPLHLTAVEELSYAEVAAILDIPVGTVMSRIYRARRLLTSMIGGYDR